VYHHYNFQLFLFNEFYNGFQASTTYAFKNKHHLENSLIFNLVVIQPWHGSCLVGRAHTGQLSSSSSWKNTHIGPDLDYEAVNSKFSLAFGS